MRLSVQIPALRSSFRHFGPKAFIPNLGAQWLPMHLKHRWTLLLSQSHWVPLTIYCIYEFVFPFNNRKAFFKLVAAKSVAESDNKVLMIKISNLSLKNLNLQVPCPNGRFLDPELDFWYSWTSQQRLPRNYSIYWRQIFVNSQYKWWKEMAWRD